ncbi:phenylalanine--tRNA ligase subunit beta [bacterium]|nr:phenylalanine--tRNA ligase subunit beta [bacterium]
MKFSYKFLQSFFEKRLPKPEKLAELFTMHNFEVIDIEKKKEDVILDVDILPNRGDCFSHLGLAREISAISGIPISPKDANLKSILKKTKFDLKEEIKKVKRFVNIEVKDKENCSRYNCRVIIDVKVGPSPKWLKEKLENCGLNSINNIVDITNYVMLETGQPIHAFDLDKISDNIIVIREAKKGERIVTLDNNIYDLDKDILIISDRKDPLAIAGIKGGKKAEITKDTKNIVLESANFSPSAIRKSSRKLNLITDASIRFEHNLDPNLTEIAINRAAYLIKKISNGKVCKGMIDIYSKKVFPKRIKLDANYVERLLGVKIPDREIRNIFKRLGFASSEAKLRNKRLRSPLRLLRYSSVWEVTIPTWRQDISLQEDLIEEIGRIYGYDKIPSKFPLGILTPPRRNLEIFWEDITKDALKELGFTEVYNYSFISEKDAEIFGYNNIKKTRCLVEIENPVSNEFQYLRPSQIPNLLKNVRENVKRFNEIKIFELGKTFTRPNFQRKLGRAEEKRMLTGVITDSSFYYGKGVVDNILNKLGITNVWYDQYEISPLDSEPVIWNLEKCAEIKLDDSKIGFLGEISDKVSNELKIPKVVVFNLDFDLVQKFATEEHEYRPISRFPASVRDIAVLVGLTTKVIDVLNVINRVGGKIVRDVDLFDMYQGEKIPEGKKNLAFHIIYQADDHTLTDEEINNVHNKIMKALEKEGWEVRK